jgi:Na+-driven multidrug efflux pump
MTNESIPCASSKAGISAPQGTAPRTRVLLHGPIILTLLRLGPPNIVVNVVLIAVTASVDAHFVGKFGPNALAGISLVFPLIMLMQQVANSSMGGAIAAAVARAIGAGRHDDASALVIHGVIIAAGMAAIFALILLIGGPTTSGLTAVEMSFRDVRLTRRLFVKILRVGVPMSLQPSLNNVGLAFLTGFVGSLGAAQLAGFGVAARLEYILYPLTFGIDAGLLAVVGTNLGAGNYAQVVRAPQVSRALSLDASDCSAWSRRAHGRAYSLTAPK